MLKQAFFKTIFLFLSFYLFSITVYGQQKYWLEFEVDDLHNQNKTLQLLKSNIQATYPDQVEFLYQSKWIPAISISTQAELVEVLQSYALVKRITPQRELQTLSYNHENVIQTSKKYAYALEQIKAHFLTDSMGLSGKNVKIGVVDGGFRDADSEPSLQHLMANNQIKFFKDYLKNGNEDPFYGHRIAGDGHGTQVLKMIAGSENSTSMQYGMAQNAEFYLIRTDHGLRETRLEEDYWVEAIETFYQLGVRLVNSSLGYTDGFDKRKENHHKSEVDGKSSMITKTAQKAAEKGMLIVSAAGNDGNSKWEILSLPSDAKDILTVGASRFDEWSKFYYSSIGPEAMEYVKPDVVCFSSEGTSFSAPVITGLAACVWESDSTLTNLEVINIIKSASHLAESPNNYLGYGVPDSKKIMRLLRQEEIEPALKSIATTQDFIEIEIPTEIETLVVFHKRDVKNVIEQETIKIEEGQSTIKIENKTKAKFSTVVARDQLLIEIEWE